MCLIFYFRSCFCGSSSPSRSILTTTRWALQPTPNPSSLWKETEKQTRRNKKTRHWGVAASRWTAWELLHMTRLKINRTSLVKIKTLTSQQWGTLKRLLTQSAKKDWDFWFVDFTEWEYQNWQLCCLYSIISLKLNLMYEAQNMNNYVKCYISLSWPTLLSGFCSSSGIINPCDPSTQRSI